MASSTERGYPDISLTVFIILSAEVSVLSANEYPESVFVMYLSGNISFANESATYVLSSINKGASLSVDDFPSTSYSLSFILILTVCLPFFSVTVLSPPFQSTVYPLFSAAYLRGSSSACASFILISSFVIVKSCALTPIADTSNVPANTAAAPLFSFTVKIILS